MSFLFISPVDVRCWQEVEKVSQHVKSSHVDPQIWSEQKATGEEIDSSQLAEVGKAPYICYPAVSVLAWELQQGLKEQLWRDPPIDGVLFW